jgi:hypothetical protein
MLRRVSRGHRCQVLERNNDGFKGFSEVGCEMRVWRGRLHAK